MEGLSMTEYIGLEGRVLFTLPVGDGIPVYTYGAVIALAALACFILFMIRAKKAGRGTAAAAGCLMTVLGFVLSRLVYCFSTQNFLNDISFRELIAVSHGGFSMFGALGGMVLGAWIAARLFRKNTGDVLDALAPCLVLFVLIARCGEWNSNLGISRELTEDRGNAWLYGTVFACDQDGFYYLRTYLFEAVTALVIIIVLLTGTGKNRKSGNLFLRFMILYGATQVIWESLRYDQHMKFNFVGVQHIVSYTVLTIALVILAVRRIRSGGAGKALAALALALVLPVAGAAVFLEFKIDRSLISRYLLYGIYAVLMGGMAALGLYLEKRDSAAETARG
ncbi:MAG: hypothetical protein CW338_07090 [Clostridiales bacterium]|nr:hypothetical protein [Clostridiales bacterium]